MKVEDRISFIVEELKRIRIERNLSVRALAKQCGLSHGGLRHMENGDVSPTLFFLLTVADNLDVDLADLLKDSDQNNRKNP